MMQAGSRQAARRGRHSAGPARVLRGGALIAWAALLATAACAPSLRGNLGPAGYSSDYGYQVAALAGKYDLLPPEWRLENFRREGGEWVRKEGDDYVTHVAFDENDDGRNDAFVDLFTYALRYEHRVHAGVIWLRDIAVSAKLRSKDLRVVMQEYIDEIAGATYETVQLGSVPSSTIVVERREAAAIVEQGPAMVAGLPAYVATIDVSNIDQVKLTPGVPAHRVQLVLLRAPQDEHIPVHRGKRRLVAPVLLLAGYSNRPEDFATGLGDFHGFLGRLTVAGKAGFELGVAGEAPATAEPVAPAGPPSATVPAPAAPPATP